MGTSANALVQPLSTVTLPHWSHGQLRKACASNLSHPKCKDAATPRRFGRVVVATTANHDVAVYDMTVQRRSLAIAGVATMIGLVAPVGSAFAFGAKTPTPALEPKPVKSAPPAPEGPAMDKFNGEVNNLAVLVRKAITIGSQDSSASDDEIKSLTNILGKPIKYYFLDYGLRNGRMVLDKKLYAATPEYQAMYDVLGELNKFKEANAPVLRQNAPPLPAPLPRLPVELKDALLSKLAIIT